MQSYIETMNMLIDITDFGYWDFHMKTGAVHTGTVVYLSVIEYPHGKLYGNLIDITISAPDRRQFTFKLCDVDFVRRSDTPMSDEERCYYMDNDMPTCSVLSIAGRDDFIRSYAKVKKAQDEGNTGPVTLD